MQRRRMLGWMGLAAGFALSAASRPVEAQQRASQLVVFRVLPASQATMAPATQPLTLHPSRATESRTSYSIGSNDGGRKITASLDRALPSGATLSVALAAPAGATSAGRTPLDTVSMDLVTEIPAASEKPLPVVYTLRAGASEPAAAAGERTVTYTVVEAP